MICTATIQGMLVELSGTPEECAEFFKLSYTEKISHGILTGKKVCDPMARHMGNCGADDCPLIPAKR